MVISDAPALVRGYIRYNHADDTMKFYSAGSPAVTLDSSQYVGIGTETPVGLIHAYDSFGGCLYWESTVSGGGETTIIPNGSGDVTKACVVTYICSATTVYAGVATMTTPGSGSTTHTMYNDGATIVVLRLYSTGQLTIDETTGTATAYVNVWTVWQ